MPSRSPSPKLPKIHRSYTVEEAATLLGMHRGTIRQWIKKGLQTCDEHRPTLILGKHLSEFLEKKRTKSKKPCKSGEIYCVRCRLPKTPAGDMAEYQVISDTVGNLIGICPTCDLLMNRRVSNAKLTAVLGNLQITLPQALRHIAESIHLTVNSDFSSGGFSHVKTQPKE